MDSLFAEDLPPGIALWECRLNLEHQYSSFMAYMMIDVPIAQIQTKIAMESLQEAGLL